MSAQESQTSRRADLSKLKPAAGSNHRTKRLGRGIGSGTGKTCGRGHKGQKSRAGKKIRAGFEGGQMPYHRRIPKRGFSSHTASSWLRLPTSALHSLEPGDVTVELLRKVGWLGHYQDKVKFYRSGEVTASYVLTGINASAGARQQIEAAGGKLVTPDLAKKVPAS